MFGLLFSLVCSLVRMYLAFLAALVMSLDYETCACMLLFIQRGKRLSNLCVLANSILQRSLRLVVYVLNKSAETVLIPVIPLDKHLS